MSYRFSSAGSWGWKTPQALAVPAPSCAVKQAMKLKADRSIKWIFVSFVTIGFMISFLS